MSKPGILFLIDFFTILSTTEVSNLGTLAFLPTNSRATCFRSAKGESRITPAIYASLAMY